MPVKYVIPVEITDLVSNTLFNASTSISSFVPKDRSNLMDPQDNYFGLFIGLGVLILILAIAVLWLARKGIRNSFHGIYNWVRDTFPAFCHRHVNAGLIWDSMSNLPSYTGYRTSSNTPGRSTFYVGTPEPLPEDIPRTIEEQIEVDSNPPRSAVKLGQQLSPEDLDSIQIEMQILRTYVQAEQESLDNEINGGADNFFPKID